MTCKFCGKEIIKFTDYQSKNKCIDCHREHWTKYMQEYRDRNREKYNNYHREYWHGRPIPVFED